MEQTLSGGVYFIFKALYYICFYFILHYHTARLCSKVAKYSDPGVNNNQFRRSAFFWGAICIFACNVVIQVFFELLLISNSEISTYATYFGLLVGFIPAGFAASGDDRIYRVPCISSCFPVSVVKFIVLEIIIAYMFCQLDSAIGYLMILFVDPIFCFQKVINLTMSQGSRWICFSILFMLPSIHRPLHRNIPHNFMVIMSIILTFVLMVVSDYPVVFITGQLRVDTRQVSSEMLSDIPFIYFAALFGLYLSTNFKHLRILDYLFDVNNGPAVPGAEQELPTQPIPPQPNPRQPAGCANRTCFFSFCLIAAFLYGGALSIIIPIKSIK